MRPTLLFVYGTLRADLTHPMHRFLRRYAVFVGKATAQGELYEIARYPGMVLSSNPRNIVCGELYRIRRTKPLLKLLDRYEECGEGFDEPHEYRREIIRVVGIKGCAEAWAYIYNRSVATKRRIKSGDYLFKNAATPPCALRCRRLWCSRLLKNAASRSHR